MGTVKELFVEKFETVSGGSYIYDVNNGMVIARNDLMDAVIEEVRNDKTEEETVSRLSATYSEASVRGMFRFVTRWSNNYAGFFKGQIQETETATVEKFDKEYDKGMLYLMVLSVTEDCNFRCKYCYLSEEYKYTRNRTDKTMDFATAKAALDFYFAELRKIKKKIPNKKAGVTLYGGEPLMNIKLVREIVDYCNKYAPMEISLNMTTNGYFLSDEIADFVVENDIHLAVSLDGNEANHDRNRVMTKDTKTHARVLENVLRFKKRYPDFPNIGLVSVYDVKTDLDANIDFFLQNDLPRIFFINEVSSNNTDYYDRFSEEDYAKFRERYSFLMKDYVQKKKKGIEMSQYQRMIFEMPLLQTVMRFRKEDTKAPIVPYTNTCLPGAKLYVRTDGTIDVCERVNGTYPIGNLRDGLNKEVICEMINEYNRKITQKCGECSAKRNCPLCFAYANDEHTFSAPEGFCANWRNTQLSRLGVIYSILEEEPHAFDEINIDFENALMFEA